MISNNHASYQQNVENYPQQSFALLIFWPQIAMVLKKSFIRLSASWSSGREPTHFALLHSFNPNVDIFLHSQNLSSRLFLLRRYGLPLRQLSERRPVALLKYVKHEQLQKAEQQAGRPFLYTRWNSSRLGERAHGVGQRPGTVPPGCLRRTHLPVQLWQAHAHGLGNWPQKARGIVIQATLALCGRSGIRGCWLGLALLNL